MKILAVRGKNLASLERFEVEFESGPLEHAGIFAITGPTGAGKTTLLDALCVALFDRTPRLSNKAGVPVGTADQDDGMRVRANDVRGILRRGAAEGFAEVEFVGRDGRRYAARWSVHRSRRRATGKLQASEVSLTDLETEQITAGKKTETLAEIESKLGLSFEQFRRSALLAQNDFAAFLRADEKQRSDLLERMTGTEIYTKVSVAAYRRADREAKELEALQGSADGSAILDDEVREELVAKRNSLLAEHKELSAKEKAVASHIKWFDDLRKATAMVDEARASLAKAEEAVLAHDDVVARIRRVREAREVRGLVDGDEAAKERVRSATAHLAKAEEARTAAEEAARNSEADVAAAQEAVAKARERYVEELRREMATIEEQRGTLSAWLAAHKEFASAGGESEEFLAMAVEALDLIQPSLEGEAESLSKEEAERAEAVRFARDRKDAADGERDALAAELETSRLAELRADDGRLVELAANLRSLASLHKNATAAEKALEEANREYQAAAARGEELAGAIPALEERQRMCASLLAEAEAAYDRIRLALDLTDHRAALVAGEHCPLCGSEEHPWREDDATASVVDEQRRRVETLREDEASARSAVERTKSEAAATQTVQTRAQDAIRERTGELAELGRESEELVALPGMGELKVVFEADAIAEAQRLCRSRHEALRAELLALESLETKAKQAAAVAKEAGLAWEEASKAHEKARDAHSAATKKLDACKGYRYRTRDAELARLTAARAACEEKQAAAPTWRPEAEHDALLAAEARKLRAGHALVTAEAAVKNGAEALREAKAAHAEAEAKLVAHLEKLGSTREELVQRLAVTDEWLSSSQKAVDAANEARSMASGRLRESEVRKAQLLEAKPESGDSEEELAARHRELEAKLEATVEEGVAIRAQLLADENARAKREALGEAIEKATERVRVFRTLSELIGSADGKKFRVFAQSLTLDSLLDGANAHLKELAPRYLLQRVPGHDLDLQVVDRDLADEVRSVNSLSGGESFLISLALALGLSSLSSKDVRVESLLIDEGFGSLDGDTLEVALSVLDSLQATGRKVGLISHVPGFAERIGAQVIVTPKGGGRSSVHVQGPMSYR